MNRGVINLRYPALSIMVGLAMLVSACASRNQMVTVSAAASLTDALTDIADAFEVANPELTVELNLAGSGTLAAQIRQGAPADVFISASMIDMDALEAAGLVLPATRSDIASNQLVLVVPSNSMLQSDMNDIFSTIDGPVAIGNPDLVPAGTYARQSLQSMGWWDTLQTQLVYGESVRQVLAWVETGEAAMGVVYATDAQSSQRVRTVGQMPSDSHQLIRYPIALISNSESLLEGQQFLDFVLGAQGQAILARHGFAAPIGATP